MKILLVQDRLRGGGTERQTVFLAHAFAARGHPVTLLTFRPGGTLTAELAGSGVDLRALQPFDTQLDWFAPSLVRAARMVAPDIALCMGRMANCRAGQLQRALPGTAVIATVRTGKNLPWLYRGSLRAVRHVIANSEFARRTLVAPETPTERCTVIPNALLHSALLNLAPEDATADRPLTLLCVAQFRPEKNQRELLEIVATLPAQVDWRLVFVGDGITRPGCERLAARLGLGGKVSFHGWQRDPAPFFRTAAVAVLTSLSESLPNFLIEAQCAGLPVISYKVGGVDECFHNGITGHLIPAGDREHFSAALLELLTQPDRRSAMAVAARKWAREQFAPDRQVEAHLALFRSLLPW